MLPLLLVQLHFPPHTTIRSSESSTLSYKVIVNLLLQNYYRHNNSAPTIHPRYHSAHSCDNVGLFYCSPLCPSCLYPVVHSPCRYQLHGALFTRQKCGLLVMGRRGWRPTAIYRLSCPSLTCTTATGTTNLPRFLERKVIINARP